MTDKEETFQPVIKWTGSKRKNSYQIARLFPEDYNTYYEPFIGGGSILYQENPGKAVAGDICEPLIGIWRIIRDNPDELHSYYKARWQRLQDEGHEVYYEIRDKFNDTKKPKHLYFLSRTCVNGLIRFNQKGEFNNSFHHTRPGIHPKRLEKIINYWSSRIQNTEFKAQSYNETMASATKNDFVYLDPPYFNTKDRYYGGIDQEEFLEFLKELNERGVKYALSFDGHSGDKDYTVDMPDWSFEEHLMLTSGNSSFRKTQDKVKDEVKESLYLNYDPSRFAAMQTRLQNY